MIPGDLLSAFSHRQFHTLPGLLDSWAALPNSYPNALRAMQGGSLYHFYYILWYDPAERRTHDLPCERRTRYRLSQPDTVSKMMLFLVSSEIDNWFYEIRSCSCVFIYSENTLILQDLFVRLQFINRNVIKHDYLKIRWCDSNDLCIIFIVNFNYFSKINTIDNNCSVVSFLINIKHFF